MSFREPSDYPEADKALSDYDADVPAVAAAARAMLGALKKLMETLRREAPGTTLNNHRFDALGIKAYAAIAQAEAAGITAEAPANTLPASSRLAQGDAP